MRRIMFILLAAMLASSVGIVQAENAISVQAMPPVVVKTFPQAGETSVDASLKEIRVTFSKDMMTHEMWSWVMVSKDSFPTIVGEVRYLNDKRTCVAPVRLKAGKTYAIWFNSKNYNAFRDKYNNPAIPYLLVFKTAD